MSEVDEEIEFLESEIRRQEMLKNVVQKYALTDEETLTLTEVLARAKVTKKLQEES